MRERERERERERVAKLLEWPNFVPAECHWQVLNLPKWLRRRQNSSTSEATKSITPKATKSGILCSRFARLCRLACPRTIFDLWSKQLTLGRVQTRLALLSLTRCFNSLWGMGESYSLGSSKEKRVSPWSQSKWKFLFRQAAEPSGHG